MMMAEEAKKLGHTIVSLDPNPQCSITKFSDCHISKEYNDKEVLQYMYETCDVITYEFENVDLNVLRNYIDKIPQKLKALEKSRNRLVEKDYAQKLNIKTPNYQEVITEEDVFMPSIVKTTTGGYDGKGQYKITDKSQIDHISEISTVNYICEELITFDYEISVVATRDSFGNIAFYPIPVNDHVNGILHTSIVNNSIPSEIQEKAISFTKAILEDLDYIGTLAVEYFVKGNEVLFNEFAPRPHNSGHYTQDGCQVSQFKNHILAITNEKIIEPKLIKNTVMVNVLGQNKAYYEYSSKFENAAQHDYYKNSSKHNRKIGHINVLYKTDEELQNILQEIIKE